MAFDTLGSNFYFGFYPQVVSFSTKGLTSSGGIMFVNRRVIAVISTVIALATVVSGCAYSKEVDKSVCSQISVVLAPMNDGTAPNLSKWDVAWPQIQDLSSKAAGSDLKDSLATLADSMRTFVFTVRADGKAPSLIAPLMSDMNAVYNSCERLLTQ